MKPAIATCCPQSGAMVYEGHPKARAKRRPVGINNEMAMPAAEVAVLTFLHVTCRSFLYFQNLSISSFSSEEQAIFIDAADHIFDLWLLKSDIAQPVARTKPCHQLMSWQRISTK